MGTAPGGPRGVGGTGHSPPEGCQAQDLKECALGDGHREVGDATGTSPLSRPGTVHPQTGCLGAHPGPAPLALRWSRPTQGTERLRSWYLPRRTETRRGGPRQPHKGQAAETAWSPRRDEWTDSSGPVARRSVTCPPRGNSHEGYGTDETHVKQVRQRPQVVGLLLDKRPEQANPRGSEQPGGYQGWGGGETASGIRGNILETRGAGDRTELDTVSCECHRTVLEKQDISQKPKNTNRLHQQAGFKRVAGKAEGSLRALQFWVGVFGAGATCPSPS